MNIEQKINLSETRQFKVIIPGVLNANNTLFGGIAMQWMDEVAYITATRFTRQKVVTVCSDKINFKYAVPYGTIVEIVGRIFNVGMVKIEVAVEIYLEHMFAEGRQKVIEGKFTFAAVDDNNKPIKLKMS
ncbi:MAG: acyl-CoA thioesterase [Bacteroidales bacterium]